MASWVASDTSKGSCPLPMQGLPLPRHCNMYARAGWLPGCHLSLVQAGPISGGQRGLAAAPRSRTSSLGCPAHAPPLAPDDGARVCGRQQHIFQLDIPIGDALESEWHKQEITRVGQAACHDHAHPSHPHVSGRNPGIASAGLSRQGWPLPLTLCTTQCTSEHAPAPQHPQWLPHRLPQRVSLQALTILWE
jgi:hypothetical protein